jgi:hypothetical protein
MGKPAPVNTIRRYKTIIIQIYSVTKIFFYPEYSRAVSKNSIKWLKCKFVSKFCGSRLQRTDWIHACMNARTHTHTQTEENMLVVPMLVMQTFSSKVCSLSNYSSLEMNVT